MSVPVLGRCSIAVYLLQHALAQQSYLAPKPESLEGVSVAILENNWAVLPDNWSYPDLQSSAFYELDTDDQDLASAAEEVASADFIAFDSAFLDVLGPEATLERILNFTGEDAEHVHEAPVYVPDTNELVFSDTVAVGWLWAVEVDTGEVRNITTNPPLSNVNGGTYHKGTAYFTTNGSPIRGIYSANITADSDEAATTAIVNNYRGRRLNSPNDVIVDSHDNLWFTDPAYGWYSEFDGVTEPEVPQAIYFFNSTSGALNAVSNDVVHVPNGLALSPDEKTLYVGDSANFAARPMPESPGLDGLRNLYAFDVATYPLLSNPRLIYQKESGFPDGMRVSQSGYVVLATPHGADVIDPSTGTLLGRFSTPGDVIYNVQGIPGTGVWLLTGNTAVYKVTVAEKSLEAAT